MDNSDGSATGRGGSIRRDTYRHLLAFYSRIYALCSMVHFRYHVHYCLLVITGILICIFCAPATCRNLWYLSGVILISSYWPLMRWGEGITSVLSRSSGLSLNLTINFQTGSSLSGRLVDKLVATLQNIPSSSKCDPNLFEYTVTTIMRVLRHSGIYLIRSRVIRVPV